MKTRLLLSALLLPLAAFAGQWDNGQFEVGGIYGRTDSRIGNENFYGGYVAAGYYFGNHLFQLQVSGLTSENLGGFSRPYASPTTPQSFDYTLNRSSVQEYPVWFRYSYGFSFGPEDRIRLEAGPLLGARIVSMATTYGGVLHTPGQPDVTYTGLHDRTGGVAFDYGLSAALKIRIAEHWSVAANYLYLRSTDIDLRPEIAPLGSTTGGVKTTVYIPGRYPEHGTHFVTLGAEYRF